MYEEEKALLKKLCRNSNDARREALAEALRADGVRYENWDGMALVVPSQAERTVVLCAHFDAVPYSFGYNDNGMALVLALKFLRDRPKGMEFVFTNGEEKGCLGARHYLSCVKKTIQGCVNLDVVGCFDKVYLDPMNCEAAKGLGNCKQGKMPLNDGGVFAAKGIASVCFSSGPAETPFDEGIMRIGSTIHNNFRDNDFSILNFAMLSKVAAEVEKAASLMAV